MLEYRGSGGDIVSVHVQEPSRIFMEKSIAILVRSTGRMEKFFFFPLLSWFQSSCKSHRCNVVEYRHSLQDDLLQAALVLHRVLVSGVFFS